MQLLFSGRFALLDHQQQRSHHGCLQNLHRPPGLRIVQQRAGQHLRTAATRKPRKTKKKDPEPEEVEAAPEPQESQSLEEVEDGSVEAAQTAEPDTPDTLDEKEVEDLALLNILVKEELQKRQYADPDFLPTTRPSPVLSNREVH